MENQDSTENVNSIQNKNVNSLKNLLLECKRIQEEEKINKEINDNKKLKQIIEDHNEKIENTIIDLYENLLCTIKNNLQKGKSEGVYRLEKLSGSSFNDLSMTSFISFEKEKGNPDWLLKYFKYIMDRLKDKFLQENEIDVDFYMDTVEIPFRNRGPPTKFGRMCYICIIP